MVSCCELQARMNNPNSMSWCWTKWTDDCNGVVDPLAMGTIRNDIGFPRYDSLPLVKDETLGGWCACPQWLGWGIRWNNYLPFFKTILGLYGRTMIKHELSLQVAVRAPFLHLLKYPNQLRRPRSLPTLEMMPNEALTVLEGVFYASSAFGPSFVYILHSSRTSAFSLVIPRHVASLLANSIHQTLIVAVQDVRFGRCCPENTHPKSPIVYLSKVGNQFLKPSKYHWLFLVCEKKPPNIHSTVKKHFPNL